MDHPNPSSLSVLSLCPSPDEVITSHGAIEADRDHVRREPYTLPQGFMWDTLDLGSADVVSTRPRAGRRRGGSQRHRQDARLLL